jgi:Predicted membrane protein
MEKNIINLTKKEWICRVSFYLLGMLILALGLTLNTKADLGVSAIISVPYCVSLILGTNFGDMTFIMYVVLVAAQFVIKGKDRKLADLLQLVLSLVFTRFLNIFGSLIPSAPDHFGLKLAVLSAALVLTGTGAAMSVNARLIPNPGDGIVAAVSDRTGRDLGFVKNCVDLACISITITIGLIAEQSLIGVGIGTVLSVIFVGRCVWLYNKLFSRRVAALSGLDKET